MSKAEFDVWDLKKIIKDLKDNHPQIEEIYLFGSRAYKTGSFRSDIDILAFTNMDLPVAEVNAWLHEEYPPVDLFISDDKKCARSVINGSVVSYRGGKKNKDLIEQLDAIYLWSRSSEYSEKYSDWIIKTLKDNDFHMSIIPANPIMNVEETLEQALKKLGALGVKTFFAGSSWNEIAESITKMVEIAMKKPKIYQKKAKSFKYDKIVIENEYDFQNMILTVLRPVFPEIEMENVVITLDGAKKRADFGIANNKIIIEAKWIDSESKKNAVEKTLGGLGEFYKQNANVSCLIFLILYDRDVKLDRIKLNAMFSKTYQNPRIIVRYIENEYY